MTTEDARSPIAAAPLAATAAALRGGETTLEAHVNAACDRLDAHEARVRALLPEPGRRARLAVDARALAERFPDPTARPPLYGVLAAFKDIYAVAGFETRAGSAAANRQAIRPPMEEPTTAASPIPSRSISAANTVMLRSSE